MTGYLHGLDLLFTGYADNIFDDISNFHIQRSKILEKSDKFGGNFKICLTLQGS